MSEPREERLQRIREYDKFYIPSEEVIRLIRGETVFIYDKNNGVYTAEIKDD